MIKRIIKILFIIFLIFISTNIIFPSSQITIVSQVLKKEEEVNTYLGYLKIPKIDLNLGFFNYDNPLNDVSKNIEFIQTGINNTYLFAAHSGVGKNAYFNDLRLLELGDDLYLEFKDKVNHYQVQNIRKEDKDGDISIKREENMLILTTCDQIVKGKQLIIESILITD